MQKQLGKYIKRNAQEDWQNHPDKVHSELVSKGLCPSDVTVDQLAVIIRDVQEH
ncbi:hypothetical protein [Planctobacterium marinum]|uniref:Uncharacterized protein n=1 Tax=Planctobacterium marinum TaxID=1631968 RepID=A0AA48HHW2_9ALTE|nr:hypothetical protein MACH26_04970 [Planctobacterium marinum]